MGATRAAVLPTGSTATPSVLLTDSRQLTVSRTSSSAAMARWCSSSIAIGAPGMPVRRGVADQLQRLLGGHRAGGPGGLVVRSAQYRRLTAAALVGATLASCGGGARACRTGPQARPWPGFDWGAPRRPGGGARSLRSLSGAIPQIVKTLGVRVEWRGTQRRIFTPKPCRRPHASLNQGVRPSLAACWCRCLVRQAPGMAGRAMGPFSPGLRTGCPLMATQVGGAPPPGCHQAVQPQSRRQGPPGRAETSRDSMQTNTRHSPPPRTACRQGQQ